jgi:hypothetical protein
MITGKQHDSLCKASFDGLKMITSLTPPCHEILSPHRKKKSRSGKTKKREEFAGYS